MGGDGSGRKPGTENVVRGLLGFNQPAPTDNAEIYLPNYSGIQEVALKTSVPLSSGSGTPGGNDTEIQFNDGGSFGGDSELVWDKTTNILSTATGDIRVSTAGTNTASVVTVGGTQTVTNKTFDLTDNTLNGTTAEFNTALSDDNFATLTNSVTLTNKTIDEAVISGTPDAEGEFGRDTTQKSLNTFNNGTLGTIPKVIHVSRPEETLTNSTTNDQDFTTVYTFPANTIFTNKVYRITFNMENVTGSTSATISHYIKIGSTKIWESLVPLNLADSRTLNSSFVTTIIGTEAAGASTSVECTGFEGMTGAQGNNNGISQPVAAIATNGTLALTPGITYSATGGTESTELLSVIIEELN